MDATKYIGKKASKCRKCNSDMYFVNKLGGIQCELCSPPKNETDATLRLRIEGGVWQDSSVERFDLIDVPVSNISPSPEIESQSRQGAVATRTSAEKHCGAKSSALNDFVVAYGSRGICGELSAREVFLFTHESIWNGSGLSVELPDCVAEQFDSVISIKPKVRAKAKK